MTAKAEIISILNDYEAKGRDENHWVRRFYRCFIDGSYTNQEHYKSNIAYIKENKGKEKKMISFVIGQFTAFIAKEFGISLSHSQKCIIESKIDLNKLNQELIDDSLDLIAE